MDWTPPLPPAGLMALGALLLSAGAYGTNYGRFHAISFWRLALFGALTIGGGLIFMSGTYGYYAQSKIGYVLLATVCLAVFFAANELGKRHGKRDEERDRGDSG